MRRHRGPLLAAALIFAGFAVFFVSQGLNDSDKWASVGSFMLGALAFVVTVLGLRVAARQASPPIGRRLDRLAETVETQWQDEAERRGLTHPLPLPVRWSSADPGLMDRLSTVAGRPVADDEQGRVRNRYLTGYLPEVAEVFTRLPTQRLVVLGEPGAGKTALAVLLILELLRRREPGDPVPALLTLSSWNPAEQHPHAWMAAQLEQTYPALRTHFDEAGQRTTLASYLVRTRRILPVFDGLDEMPAHLRAPALRALNRTMSHRGDPLLLTCRTQEYREILTTVAAPESAEPVPQPLAAAAAVELCPLDADDIKAYLRDATPEYHAHKWVPVFDRMDQQPDGPLAQALSTPLMTALARTAYSQTTADPAALLSPTNRAQVEEHLIDQLIPAVYTSHPSVGDQRTPWTAGQAARWLRFLAQRMHKHNTGDLAWWDLARTSRILFGIGLALVAGVAAALVIWLWTHFAEPVDEEWLLGYDPPAWVPDWIWFRLEGGFTYSAVFGRRSWQAGLGSALGGLLAGLWGAPRPSAARIRFHGGLVGAAGGLMAALGLGFMVGVGTDLWLRLEYQSGYEPTAAPDVSLTTSQGPWEWFTNGPSAGLESGLMAALVGAILFGLGGLMGRGIIRRALAGVLIGLGLGITGGIVLGLLRVTVPIDSWPWAGLQSGVGGGLVLGLFLGVAGLLSPPTDTARAANPRSVLRGDRDRAISIALLITLGGLLVVGIGLGSGLSGLGAGCGLLFAIVSGLVVALRSAWGGLVIVRIWFALRRRSPWRVMRFLDDAYRRGVLRQVGAVYQFRHARLQDRLARDNIPA